MGRHLVIASAIAAALLIAGYLLYRELWTDEDQVATGAAPVDEPPGAAAPDSAPPAAASPPVRVTELSGTVERQAGGVWRPAAVGDRLGAAELLRTSASATAVLDVGGNATVRVAGGSQFSVGDMARDVSAVRLDNGRLQAEVRGGGPSLRVSVNGSDAVAESADGRFSVLSAGTGSVTVATEGGRVKLSARQKTVELSAGQQSVVVPGSAPSAPLAIPPELFLKVGRPPARLARKETVVSGNTVPGAVVSVNGVVVTADASGGFTAKVPLVEGRNTVVVQASDAVGRHQQRELAKVVVDTRPPTVDGEVTWGR